MDRWTIEELEKIDDIDFAVAILNERRNRLNPYSPLSTKLRESANTLTMIRAEKERFLSRITGQQKEVEHKSPFRANYWNMVYVDENGERRSVRDMEKAELERIGTLVAQGYACGQMEEAENV